MSQSITRTLRLLPGVALLAAIGLLGKLTEQSIARYGKAHHLALPNIEYVLWAIVFGLILSNTIGVAGVFRAGVATYEFWLETGIVLLGGRLLLGDILKLGGVSLACVAVELAVSIALMTALGRWMRLSPKLTSLLAIGSSICGASASIAAKGAIGSCVRIVGGPGRGQSGRSDGSRRTLFRCGREIRGAGQNGAQCDYRFRGAGLRHLLSTPEAPKGRGKQGRVPVAEVPEVRPGIPADFASCHRRRIHQAADCRSGQSVALGVSAYFCRRGFADKYP